MRKTTGAVPAQPGAHATLGRTLSPRFRCSFVIFGRSSRTTSSWSSVMALCSGVCPPCKGVRQMRYRAGGGAWQAGRAKRCCARTSSTALGSAPAASRARADLNLFISAATCRGVDMFLGEGGGG